MTQSLASAPPGQTANIKSAEAEAEYITLTIADQMFGLAIGDVNEVFAAHQITPVPLASRPIKGLLNLRGRVVTAVCLRTILDLPDCGNLKERMAIGVEVNDELFALLVDRIGDVARLSSDTMEPTPMHINADWQKLSKGVHRLETSILIILDPESIVSSETLAA